MSVYHAGNQHPQRSYTMWVLWQSNRCSLLSLTLREGLTMKSCLFWNSLWTRLALNSQQSICLCLQCNGINGIKGMHHHTQDYFFLFVLFCFLNGVLVFTLNHPLCLCLRMKFYSAMKENKIATPVGLQMESEIIMLIQARFWMSPESFPGYRNLDLQGVCRSSEQK